jgi:probable rRNA maturation factor
MSPDDSHRAAALRVVITDAIGRPLRKRALARWLEAIAPARARGDVTLALVGDADIRRLNRRFVRVDQATDVLSFASDDFEAVSCPPPNRLAGPADRLQHLGDIVIATGVASRQAREAGHSLFTELRILALHGLLHLLGYDHSADDGRMASLERRLRRKGGLDEGLIDRAGSPRRSAGRAKAGAGKAGRAGRARRAGRRGKR